MVLQKRLYYGFNGFEVPAMPRASRSVRRRRLFEKKVEDSRMRAFDLLATVAGELLEEKGSSAAPSNVSAQISESAIRKDSIKQEQQDGPHSFKTEPCDQGSCDESASVFVHSSQRHGHEYLHSKEDSTFGLASVITKSERPANTTCACDFGESRKDYENFPCMICGKRHVERGSPGCAESHDGKVSDEIDRQMEVEQPRTVSVLDGTVVDMFHLKDPMEIDTKPPALVSSDSSVEVPLHGIHNHCSSFTRCQDDVKVVSRDDDENSSVSTRLSTLKSYRLSRLGDRRIRKLLASKHWKAAPAMLKKDGVFSNTESDIKPVFRSRKICYTHQRSQRCSFKRRKLFGRSLISISDRGINGEAVSSSPEKKVISEATGLGGTMHQASQKSSLESRDSHVKLRIKSFRVPELFIEIPETATVGSLKGAVHWWSMYKNFPAWVKRPYWYCTTWMRGFGHRCLLEATNPKGGQRLPTIRSLTRTVMEAVTAVLGSGLRVGVLLHGKKVRDDNRTLLQTGISHDDKLDSLGFTLEPTTVHPPPPQCSEDCHSLLPCDSTEPLTRYPPVPALEPGLPETSPDLPLADSGNSTEDSYESVPSPPDMSMEKTTPDSKALVAVPDMSVEALSVVPLHGKSRRSELVQRRIRRPFSVSEVEALVQAVEKLGTGRWRDVKLRAFENAKHRTYVDLKDKWKTLVHTARISPQQRRGEPVPQELLDRVLSAHAYWSQQNSKPGGRTNNNSNQPDSPLAAQRFD